MANQVGKRARGDGENAVVGGRYVLERRIGQGADGETWQGTDRVGGVECAVKLLARLDEAPAARLVHEFARLSELRHRNIVRVRDLGCTRDGAAGERVYLVTDLVAGVPLGDIAITGDDEARRRAFERAALGLCDALAYLHGRGLVHGDVSPANVRLDAEGQPVLIDFGLAGNLPTRDGRSVATRTAGGAGTLGYAAPEALVGDLAPSGDLFALGATLFEAWSGAAPFGAGLDAVVRMLSGPAPRLSTIRAGLGEAWDELIAGLLCSAPEARPGSAREVMRRMRAATAAEGAAPDLVAPFPGGDPLAGIVVGRDEERAALRALVDALALGSCPVAVAALAGPPGAGRATLAALATRDALIARAAALAGAVEVFPGGPGAIAAWLGDALPAPAALGDDPARLVSARMAALADALEKKARQAPLMVVMPAGDESEAFASFLAGAPASGRLLVLVPTVAALARPSAQDVVLRPLGREDVAELVRRAIAEEAPGAALDAVMAASGGNAAVVALLVRRLITALREGDAGAFHADTDDAAALLAQGLRALPAAAARVLLWTALCGRGEAPGAHLGAAEALGLDAATLRAAVDAARASGWFSDDGARLRSELHRRTVLAAAAELGLAEVAQAALQFLDGDDAVRPEALAIAGQAREAAELWRKAARRAQQAGDPAGAGRLLLRADSLAPGSLESGELLDLAGGLGALGQSDAALRVAERAEQLAPDDGTRARAVERRAWLLARRGDLAAARALLERETSALRAHAAGAQLLGGRLARLMISTGRLAEALQVAEPLLQAGEPGPAVLEAALLAHAYGGDLAGAAGLRDRLAASGVDGARLAHLDGLLAQLGGRIAEAAAHHRRAFELLAAGGDVQALATVAANLGTLLCEQGRYAEALPALERALRELGRLGASAELGTTLYNAGALFVLLGDGTAARRAIARARAETSGKGGSLAAAFALSLEAELVRREGDPAAAARRYAEAAAALERDGHSGAARAARLARAETLAAAGQGGEAVSVLAEAGAGQDEAFLLARARVALAAGAAGTSTSPAELSAALLAVAERARGEGRLPAGWRAYLLAARLDPDAERAAHSLTAARAMFEEVKMSTPIHHRAGLDSDPEARLLGLTATSSGDAAAALRAARAEGRLRRLIRINKRLNSEQRLPRLLETIIDSVIELTEAERGFLLLEDESGELAVKVARNIDQRTLEAAEFELSRSIAQQAARGSSPIITIDAAGDDRFKQAMSVTDLHLRSVLAVPLQVKGRSVGTIYVDNRLRRGAFSDEDVGLVLDFAEQAAIAVENARIVQELRRRERQVDALNRRLEAELAVRREELHGMRQELRESRDALHIRYDYKNIVGRTPRMLELFHLLDRITDTALPTVIHGESGTGKELVARALHFNGPRRERPFVSENCAAIPETLLESTLFGYVRGAFTGADHDTRGLFEVADSGTLFLDEVSEMSPAMQGKLLRVLQQGEFRRLGSERTRTVDVRVVAATNKDLARMVEEGKFRQDLYFRLKVASISLPPLRERRDDIPLLVDHFLAKAAGQGTRRAVQPAAMARMVAYRWPGNVRELENEITRAAALCSDSIGPSDLSPHVAAGESALQTTEDPNSLSLKPRVERLERTLIREALVRFDGNQTRAAEALGLSRFGLQKKLRRYAIS